MDTREAAQSYFDGLAGKDLSVVPYSDDAVLWAPLGPDRLEKPICGKEAIVAFLEGVLPLIDRVEVKNLLVEGQWASGRAFIGFNQPAGAVLRVNDIFHVVGGRIVEQENHYDPRPVLP